jgi:dCMP deaminase
MRNNRPSWDDYFLHHVVPAIASRASCDRGRSGAVVVKENRILTTGYVGSPTGFAHCDEVGHLLHKVIDETGNESMHCVRTLHAEENAILQAAMDGVSLRGATIYCKMVPCFRCAMKIIRVGIKRVVVQKRYHADHRSLKIFEHAAVRLDIAEDKTEQYSDQ